MRLASLLIALTLLELPGTTSGQSFVDAKSLSPAGRFRLAGIQAIANRDAANLFTVARDSDRSWLEAFEKIQRKKFDSITLDDAQTRWAGDSPQVIYDAARPWTISIATTLAGIHHAVLTDHDLGLKTAFDCREKWADKIEAYEWAVNELLPMCDRDRLVYLDESLPNLRDFAIANRLFTIDLDPINDQREVKLLDEILAKFPPQARVFGWGSGRFARADKNQTDVTVEWALVDRLSKKNLLLAPADFADNLSFTSKLKSADKLQQLRPRRAIAFERDRKYVLLIVSDGDNLQYDLNHLRELWTETDRPKIPLAWTISPQWATLAPAILKTYEDEARQRGGWDEFVAGPSGLAYVNPGSFDDRQLARFVDRTDSACAIADLRSVVILDDPKHASRVLDAYAHSHLDACWLAGMPKLRGVRGKLAYLNESVRFGADGVAAARQINAMNPAADPFIFVYVFAWEVNGKSLREFSDALSPNVTIVRPGEMADLIRAADHP